MLIRMKHLFGFIFTIGLCISAQALALVPDAPRHAHCFKASKKKPNWAVCEELIPDLLERHTRGEMVSGFVSCVPAGTAPEEVRQTFDAWISKRPHFAKYSAWDTLSGGLSVLYKCPK